MNTLLRQSSDEATSLNPILLLLLTVLALLLPGCIEKPSFESSADLTFAGFGTEIENSNAALAPWADTRCHHGVFSGFGALYQAVFGKEGVLLDAGTGDDSSGFIVQQESYRSAVNWAHHERATHITLFTKTLPNMLNPRFGFTAFTRAAQDFQWLTAS